MLWLFERAGESIEIETHYDSGSGEYLLTVRKPDGSRQTERFMHVATFRDRMERLESVLQVDRWMPNGSPLPLQDAWKV